MTERHTLNERVHPRYLGTRRPVGEPERQSDVPPSPMLAAWEPHDYTYGLSKASLRPAVPTDEDRDRSIPVLIEKPKPRKRAKRRTQRIVEAVQPVLYDDKPGVTMPDDTEPDIEDAVPWWMDAEVLVSRNEDMLNDLLNEELLEDSQ